MISLFFASFTSCIFLLESKSDVPTGSFWKQDLGAMSKEDVCSSSDQRDGPIKKGSWLKVSWWAPPSNRGMLKWKMKITGWTPWIYETWGHFVKCLRRRCLFPPDSAWLPSPRWPLSWSIPAISGFGMRCGVSVVHLALQPCCLRSLNVASPFMNRDPGRRGKG